MHAELPVLKRCCFCVPLRYGLLVWAYLQLLISLLDNLLRINPFPSIFSIRIRPHSALIRYYIVGSSISSLLIGTAFSLLLLVAAHKKNARLLKICFYFGLAGAVASAVFLIGDAVVIWHVFGYWEYIVESSLLGISYILLTGYVLLLVRSELLKLRSGHQFRFVNTAADADAQCTVNIEKI